MSEAIEYSLALGSLSNPILEQLEKQGFRFTKDQKKQMALIQKISSAIILLLIQGIISVRDMDKANTRMIRKLNALLKDVKRS